jgi:hypothetical protein
VIDDVLALAATEGLAEDWKRRLSERAKWLQKRLEEASCPPRTPRDQVQ